MTSLVVLCYGVSPMLTILTSLLLEGKFKKELAVENLSVFFFFVCHPRAVRKILNCSTVRVSLVEKFGGSVLKILIFRLFLGVVFSPCEAGEHTVNVTHDKLGPVKGSPFPVLVKDSEIGIADMVKVYGTGLAEGSTGKPCQFYIDTADAGGKLMPLGMRCTSTAAVNN